MYSNQFDNLGGIFIIIALFSFIWGVLQCFSGFKIFRFLIVLNGAVIGGVLGYLLTKNAAGAFLGAAAGGVLLWFFYQAGIFLMGMTLGYLITALLLLLSGHAGYGDIGLLGFIVGIAGGIFALYWHKFVIILSTAFYGAFIMAFWLGILFTRSIPDVLDSPGMLILVTLFLGFLGMLIQYEKLDGFFKGGKTIADLTITREDIRQHRKITPETMSQNLKDFKNIKDTFQQSEKQSNHYNNQQFNPEYHTQKVPAFNQNSIPLTLVQLSGTYKQQRYTVNWKPSPGGFEALVGKAVAGHNPDVNIPEPVISRKHVRLIQKKEQLFIQHLSATNPTYKNNQTLQAGVEYPLNKGDKLLMGDIHFKVE